MRGRWRAAAVLLLWLLGIVGGVPVGERRPYHAHNPQLARLEGGAREDRARREIETEERPKPRPGSPLHALEFMQKFGYVEKKSENVEEDADFVFTPQSLEEALLRVQEFGGIPQTGKLDEATVKLMETPRCGLPDLKPEELERGDGKHNRVKRYIIGADGWNKRRITYFVANWSPQLPSKERVQKELRRAFDTWSVYSHLSFSEVLTPDADIIIYFATQDHGDGYPFDYEGGILAHAFYPYEFGSYGGDIHFDESENWIIAKNKDDEGLDFFTVAVHELGHSLGLSHSPVGGSIMYPYYMGFNPSFALDYDDVMAMWELYIKRKLDGDDEYFNTTTTTTTTARPATDHQADAADTENEVWGEEEEEEKKEEKEEDIYEKDRREREEIEKKRAEERRQREEERRRRAEEEEIRRREEERRRWEDEERRRWEEEEEDRWRAGSNATPDPRSAPSDTPSSSMPDVCEGQYDAMAVLRQELFIFKGQYLWRYSSRGQLVSGYPSPITTLFPSLPATLERVSAVYERPMDGNIVFFIGDHYYVHDGNQLIEGSPRPLTDLGLDPDITEVTAAFYWPRALKTYFFTRRGYFRYNEETRQMDPKYPKPMSKWNGIPEDIDSVFTWNDGQSYFLKGREYWRYDNTNIKPADGYPRNAPQMWAACPPDTHDRS